MSTGYNLGCYLNSCSCIVDPRPKIKAFALPAASSCLGLYSSILLCVSCFLRMLPSHLVFPYEAVTLIPTLNCSCSKTYSQFIPQSVAKLSAVISPLSKSLKSFLQVELTEKVFSEIFHFKLSVAIIYSFLYLTCLKDSLARYKILTHNLCAFCIF